MTRKVKRHTYHKKLRVPTCRVYCLPACSHTTYPRLWHNSIYVNAHGWLADLNTINVSRLSGMYCQRMNRTRLVYHVRLLCWIERCHQPRWCVGKVQACIPPHFSICFIQVSLFKKELELARSLFWTVVNYFAVFIRVNSNVLYTFSCMYHGII